VIARSIARFALAASLASASASASAAVIDPPRRLTQSTLVEGASRAARDGELAVYLGTLGESLSKELKGKAPKVVARFAATDAGEHALFQYRLLSRAGPEVLADASCRDALAWILADREALATFVASAEPAGGRWPDAVRVLARVAREKRHREGLGLRVAAATALVFAVPVKWMADGSDIDPVARVDSYLAWDEEGALFPTFRELSAWEMRYVVGSWSTDADLVWARANIKAELRRRDKVGDAAHMLAYNLTNKRGVSVQNGREFYDNKPMTLAIMLEYGGVCGAISRFGSSMSQAFGVPAMPVGQPGHCAFIWQQEPHRWAINNDISGWAESGCHDGIFTPWGHPAWFMRLMQDAQRDRRAFVEAEALLAAAEFADADDRTAIAAEACRRCPQHFAAWQMRIGRGARAQDEKRLPAEMAEAFAAHPAAFAQLFNALGDAGRGTRPERTAAPLIAAMAKSGADAGLAGWGFLTVLEPRAKAIAGAGADRAAVALVRGDDPGNAAIDGAKALEVVEMALAAADSLDVAPAGPAHECWRQAMRRISRGVVLQPAVRERGMKELGRGLAVLARKGRVDDARWIADRMVEAAKETKDAAVESAATALRTSLG
jgi:hypothetical protein